MGYELNIKRFYAPFVIAADCPKCGSRVEQHCSDNYLSYPTAGESFEHHMYCSYEDDAGEYCEEEFTVTIRLDVVLTAVEGCKVMPS